MSSSKQHLSFYLLYKLVELVANTEIARIFPIGLITTLLQVFLSTLQVFAWQVLTTIFMNTETNIQCAQLKTSTVLLQT